MDNQIHKMNSKNNTKLDFKKLIDFKRIFIFLSLQVIFSSSYGQTTYFYGNSKIQGKDKTGSLYSVEIDREKNHTLVKIQLIPTRNKKRLTYQSSYNTKIRVGDFEAKLLGALSNDGKSYHSIKCSDNWGWSNPTKGKKYYYTLVFDGAVPPGLTDFALEDKGSHTGCSGYKFWNYSLDNPDNSPKTYLTETSIKKEIDKQNDGIVGIYEPFDKTGYKLGCIKDGQSYKLVYLGSGISRNWWHIGDVKAILRPSATPGFFKAEWYMANKSINSDAYVVFEGGSMKIVLDGDESGYLKMYPSNSTSSSISSGTQQWSGTGFALNSGYIATNYHVIDGAKSIYVKGVKGSFSDKYEAVVIASDKNNDLALLQIKDSRFGGFGSIPYKVKASTSEVGEDVFVLGYPLTSTMGDEIKLTTGVVSSKSGFKGDVSLYQISAPIQPGNSGGPLFDSQGNLVGIVNAKHQGAENVSYSIKASYLKNLVESVASTSILPVANSVSNMALTGKIKTLKNFVFMINCSNQSNDTNYSSSIVDSNTYSSTRNIIISNPNVSNSYSNNSDITKVTISDNYTIIEISYTNRYDSGGWCSIGKNTYISANGNNYTMTKAEGIKVSPDRTNFSYSGQKISFKLYFPPIRKSTDKINLIESAESEWKWYGVQLK